MHGSAQNRPLATRLLENVTSFRRWNMNTLKFGGSLLDNFEALIANKNILYLPNVRFDSVVINTT